MQVNKQKITEIINEYKDSDPDDLYYLTSGFIENVEYQTVPSLCSLLKTVISPQRMMIDIGCGNGITLLENSELFKEGIGIDESDFMLSQAHKNQINYQSDNVKFLRAKAVDLPFENDSFDIIFSERGPLGFSDVTLKEAIRIAKNEATILIETIGERNGSMNNSTSLLKNLAMNEKLFSENNIELFYLSTSMKKMIFSDFYNWLRFQCCSYNNPSIDDLLFMSTENFQQISDSFPNDKPVVLNHTIILAGKIIKA